MCACILYIHDTLAKPHTPNLNSEQLLLFLYTSSFAVLGVFSLDLFSIDLYPLIWLTTSYKICGGTHNHLFIKLGFRGPTSSQRTWMGLPCILVIQQHPNPLSGWLLSKVALLLRHLTACEKQDGNPVANSYNTHLLHLQNCLTQWH